MGNSEHRDPQGHLRRAEATAELTAKLDVDLNSLYPDASITEVSEAYLRGDLVHVAFSEQMLKNDEGLKLLVWALERSKNKEDPAYCRYGDDRHLVFREAIDMLIQQIEENGVSFKRQLVVNRDKGFKFERFVLETDPVTRQTAVPKPISLIAEMKNKRIGTQKQASYIRNIAVVDGVPNAVMVAVLLGMNVGQIFNIFSEKNFLQNIRKANTKIKVPTSSRLSDARLISSVISCLTVEKGGEIFPVRTYDAHIQALSLFLDAGWIDSAEFGSSKYAPAQIDQVVQAKVILDGLTGAAFSVASPELRDPVRSDYIIKNYEAICTSRVITAYLVHDDVS